MLTIVKPRPLYLSPSLPGRLSAMDVFQALPLNVLQKIESDMIERKYAKHETLFRGDEPAGFLWFVKEGYVKEIHHSTDGRDNTLCMVGANGMFGASAFEGGTYGFHSVAETDVTVLSFPIQPFRALMGKFPELGRTVVSEISKLLRQSRDMQIFSQESAEKRLLHVLIKMKAEFGNTIPLHRKEIASMAGTSTETCIRTFSRLREAGLISGGHGKIIVRDAESLKEWLDEL